MDYITQHWSFDPFVVLAFVVAVWHEIGLLRLARRSTPEQTRARRRRSLWFYAGLAVLSLAVASPLDYWGYDYFIAHMIQHLLLMFAAPTLVVAGAPWQPLLEVLPARAGSGWSRPLRALGGFVLRPWVSVVLFNAAMLVWHLPGPFDLSENNRAVHIWLTHGSFFAAGVLFWLQFIDSPPFRRRMPAVSQAAALLVTNVVMIGIAMTLSIFVSHSVYAVYNHIPGVTLPAYADQQIGAAILWVCGDFWALPTMIVVIRRLIAADGSVSAALERVLSGGASRTASQGWGWAGGGLGPGGAVGRAGAAGPRAVPTVPGVPGVPAVPAQPSPPDAES